jgi:hypothetical protein
VLFPSLIIVDRLETVIIEIYNCDAHLLNSVRSAAALHSQGCSTTLSSVSPRCVPL